VITKGEKERLRQRFMRRREEVFEKAVHQEGSGRVESE